MTPQEIIDDLSIMTCLRFIAMDASGEWYAWTNRPTPLPINRGWFAPGFHCRVNSKQITGEFPKRQWDSTAFETDVQEA